MPDDTAYSAWSGTGASTPSSVGADTRLDNEFASLAPELSRRIGAILDTIQREADKLLDQARLESQHPVDDGRREADDLISERHLRLARLSESLIARSEQVLSQLEETERVRQSFGRLLGALADAADRIADEAQATAAIPPSPPPAAAPLGLTAEPPPTPPPAEHREPTVDRAWVEARQAAIHMAAAGSTRGQVETQLRDFLGVPEPGALLDQVFSAGSVADARVPWAIAPAAPLHPRASDD